jgi:integrase/recombinase XerD
MKSLATHLDGYLELGRKLGFKLRLAGGLLYRFVAFAEKKRARFITAKLAREWACQPADCEPAQWANRLGMVRRFAHYVSASDPRTEIPAQELLPHRYHRKPPYLYNSKEICRLIQALRELPARNDLRAVSNATLFGLLAVTGMRVGEAIALDRKDVDLNRGLLTVRQAKFNKSRLVPIHVTTQKKLREYERVRNRYYPHSTSPSFLSLGERHSADRLHRSSVVHHRFAQDRSAGSHRPARSAYSRCSSPLCPENDPELVSARHGRRSSSA